jgi:hypothetical protein
VKRTPFLIRKNKVSRALEWLQLNHPAYAHMTISRTNFEAYSKTEFPIGYIFEQTDGNQLFEALATHETNASIPVNEDGLCPFAFTVSKRLYSMECQRSSGKRPLCAS